MASDNAWQAGVDIAGSNKKKGGGGMLKKIMHVLSPISNLHSGGRVKKTGNYRLKKGELVLTASQQKAHGLRKRKGKSGHRKRLAIKG